MGHPPHSRSALEVFSGIASGLAIVGGVLVLAGWAWDIDRIKRVLPGSISMNPVTAVSFILAGVSLWLQRRPPLNSTGTSPTPARRAAQLFALLVCCIGLLKLVSYVTGWEFGVDQVLFAEKLLHDGESLPNRMAPNAALNFVFLGLGLLLLGVTTRHGRPTELFALAAGFISLLALIGYVYRVELLYGVSSFIPMALHTAALCLLLALGILCARPDVGLMALVTSESPGGKIVRRLFPAMIVIISVLGWLRLEGERRGKYEAELGVALYTVANIAIFGALIWWSGRSLHRADQARKRAEAEADRFFLLSLDMLCIASAEGKFKRVSPAFTQTLGWSVEEFLARRIIDFVHPDDRAATLREIERQVASGEAVLNFENRYLHKNGSWRVLSWKSAPQTGGMMYAVARDVTERKRREEEIRQLNEQLEQRVSERTAQLETANSKLTNEAAERVEAEEALRQSEARFAKAFHSNPAAMCITSIDEGRFIEVNRHYCQILGHTEEELIGRTSLELALWADPASRAFVVKQLKAEGFIRDQETQFVRKNRELLDVQLSMELIKFPGEQEPVIVSMFFDITERKRAEEALRQSEARFAKAFHSNPAAMCITSINEGRFIEVNRHCCQIFGRTEEDLIGRTSVELALWADPARRGLVMEQLKAEGLIRDQETQFLRKNGDLLDTQLSMELIEFPGEQEPVVVSMFVDITERKRAEEEVRQLHAELEQRVVERTAQLAAANKELESFSYSVSHDLRAPLRAIDGFSQVLEEDYADKLDDSARSHLRRVRAAAGRMGELIDDLLKLSKITRAEINLQPVDLSALAWNVVRDLEQGDPERKIRWEIAEGLSAEGDPQLVRVALENLLGNAWKFTSKRPDAKIEFGQGEYDGETVFHVRDNGAGFDMAYAHKLFGAFQRLHSLSEFEGTGIGLATVLRIVNRHGGVIWAESKIDKGATFYFSFSTTNMEKWKS